MKAAYVRTGDIEDTGAEIREKQILSGSYLGVSKNSGTPKSSIVIGFSIINHTFWGTPIFGNTHLEILDNFWDILKYCTEKSLT